MLFLCTYIIGFLNTFCMKLQNPVKNKGLRDEFYEWKVHFMVIILTPCKKQTSISIFRYVRKGDEFEFWTDRNYQADTPMIEEFLRCRLKKNLELKILKILIFVNGTSVFFFFSDTFKGLIVQVENTVNH